MKKRVFQRMVDNVLEVVVDTQDWSCGDLELMVQVGEPMVNVGGHVSYVHDCGGSDSSSYDHDVKTVDFPDEFVRIRHGFPYSRLFDSRDYESFEEAKAVAEAWKAALLSKIDEAVVKLRSSDHSFVTEEVSEI